LIFSSFSNSSLIFKVVQVIVNSVILFSFAHHKISFLLVDLALENSFLRYSDEIFSNMIEFSFIIYVSNCCLLRLLLSTAVISFIFSFFVLKTSFSSLYFFTLFLIFLVLSFISVVTPAKSLISNSSTFQSFILLFKAIQIF
jgi:hypothetical protein